MSASKTPFLQQPSFAGFIGVAREDITPPVGIYSRNWGAAKHDVADGVHRPLTLACLTFQSTKTGKPLVMMAADLGGWSNLEDERIFRQNILKALKLEQARLMICFSHTHSGPALSRGDTPRTGDKFIDPYRLRLQKLAIRAAQRALAAAVPAILTWRYGRCDLATNRDLVEPGRNERFVTGFNPDKTADDTLLVGRVTNQQGRIIATVVNYACHPTTLAWDNHLLSPDYIGAMREVVEAETKAPCLFLQGASGDLAPAEQYVGDVSVPDRHGRRLGHAVLATLGGMLSPKSRLAYQGVVESGAPLAVWRQTPNEISRKFKAEFHEIKFPLIPFPPIKKLQQMWRDSDDRVMKERLWRKLALRKKIGSGKVMRAPLWVWQLGDSFLFGQPNEPYSVFQQELRRRLAPQVVAVMNIVNGSTGYLPPRHMYNEDAYTVWQTAFGKGSLEILTETSLRIARPNTGTGKRPSK